MGNGITINDVAVKAGVSTSTVSRYLNGSSKLSDESKRQIMEAISLTGYQPNLLARSLKTSKNHTILLVVPDICNPFYSLIAKTVQRIANEKGYQMSIYDTDGDEEKEENSIRIAQQMNCSGILYACIDVSPKVATLMSACNIPVVKLNAYCKDLPFDSVHESTKGATYIAMKYLLERGHKRIVFAGGEQGTTIEIAKRKGYETAMQEAGLSWNNRDIFEMGFSLEDGIKAGIYYSSFEPLPTAICCANDQIAVGVMVALQEKGIAVPDDISITGVDDISYGRITKPSLTTVTNDGSLYAETGMKMLFERIDGTYSREKREKSIPNEIIIRDSVRDISSGMQGKETE